MPLLAKIGCDLRTAISTGVRHTPTLVINPKASPELRINAFLKRHEAAVKLGKVR